MAGGYLHLVEVRAFEYLNAKEDVIPPLSLTTDGFSPPPKRG